MTLKTNRYYSVDALAGAGKTHAALEYAVKLARNTGAKFLVVQPSKVLIDESYEKCLKFVKAAGGKVKVSRFYSEPGKGSVIGQIAKHFRDAKDGGEIALITHSAFLMMPYLNRRKDWTLIFDEIPQCDGYWGLKVPETHQLFTSAVQVSESGPLHYQIEAKDKAKLEKFRENAKRDQICDIFAEPAERILSRDWKVFVRKDQWQRLLSKKGDGTNAALDMFAMLQPSVFSGFRCVILMGAMLKESLLALYWCSKGIEFKSHTAIENACRYQAHENGNLITFLYAFEEDWSKNLRDREIDGKPVLEWSVDAVQAEFQDRSFIWIANQDVPANAFPTGTRLPNIPHGLNCYQHIDNVAFLSALNRRSPQYAFLKEQGLSPEWVKMATGCQTAYQAMMRSSIRDPSNSSPKTVVVPDKTTAEYLAQVFPGCAVGQLGGKIEVSKSKPGRKPITGDRLSDAERKMRAKAKRQQKLRDQLLELATKAEPKEGTKCLYNRECVPIPDGSAEAAKACSAHAISLFKSVYSAEPSMRLRLSNNELITQLRDCHKWASTSKTANALISAAAFDPNKSPDTKRGIANIEYVNGIWLDNDDGDLTPEAFHDIHPDLKLVAYNTYSGGNRWRGFIPTTQVMSVDAHQQIMRDLIYAVEKAGYYSEKSAAKREAEGKPVKRHGFDESKFAASSLFYLPGKAEDGTCFFTEFPGNELDPITWIENAVVDLIPKLVPKSKPAPIPANSNQPPITWTGLSDCPFINPVYLGKYRATAPHSGERYNGLFGMAMSILGGAKRLGYPITECELETLLTEIDDTMGQYHQQQSRTRIRETAKSALRKKVG